MNILIIDDLVNAFEEIFNLLREQHTVLLAEDEEEGLKILNANQVDLILMDGYLGNQVLGIDVIQKLQAKGWQTPVCMFSSDEGMNARGIEVGAISAIKKNLRDEGFPTKILDHVNSLL
jgi:DNA-binding response OmpR family regulator